MCTRATRDILCCEFNQSRGRMDRNVRTVNRMMRHRFNMFTHDPWDTQPVFSNMFAAALLIVHSLFTDLPFMHCVVVACVHFVWDDEDVGVKGMIRDLTGSSESAYRVTALAMDPRVVRSIVLA
jgi:hypothetical protein